MNVGQSFMYFMFLILTSQTKKRKEVGKATVLRSHFCLTQATSFFFSSIAAGRQDYCTLLPPGGHAQKQNLNVKC